MQTLRHNIFLRHAKLNADIGGYVHYFKLVEKMVLIDVKATHYMEANFITCEKSADKGFLLKIPHSSEVTHREIKVDCNTELLDIGFSEGRLHLATIEKNGQIEKASLDDSGRWNGQTSIVVTGMDQKELHTMNESIREVHRAGTVGYAFEKFKKRAREHGESVAKGIAIGILIGLVIAIAPDLAEPGATKRSGKSQAYMIAGAAFAGGIIAIGVESMSHEDDKDEDAVLNSLLTVVRHYVRREDRS